MIIMNLFKILILKQKTTVTFQPNVSPLESTFKFECQIPTNSSKVCTNSA